IHEQGRFEWLGGRYSESLSYLRTAYARRQDDEPLRFLLRAATRAVTPVLRGGGREGAALKGAAWSPDGARLLTVDEREVRVCTDAGELLAILRRRGRPVPACDARFIRGGKEILTAGAQGVSVWGADGKWKKDVTVDASPIVESELSRDEEMLSLCTGKELVVVPFEKTGTALRVPIVDCKRARMHRDGQRAAVDFEGEIDLYELANGTKTHLADTWNTDELIWSPTDPLL